MNAFGQLKPGGKLESLVIPQPKLHRARSIKTPWGRLGFTKDRGDGSMFGENTLVSQLTAIHRRDGKVVGIHDLGSGLVTNAGVNLLANDFFWPGGATLKQMNKHLLGTGTNAAAAADVYAQTPIAAASLTGSTNGYMTGTQALVQPNIYQTTATFNINATLAITEWALCMDNALPLLRTSTGAAPTNNTFTDTGATFATAGNGLAAYTIEISATVVNTPTTTKMAQILSDTGTVLTLQGPSATTSWLTLANAVSTNPGATIAYAVFPTAWDHKVFSAINLSAGDSLQMVYQLTNNSGG